MVRICQALLSLLEACQLAEQFCEATGTLGWLKTTCVLLRPCALNSSLPLMLCHVVAGDAGISALYKAQEHAVLQEFQSFLAKLVERVSKKAAEQEAAATTSQQAAASPKQQHAAATSSQQQHSDRVPQQSQAESPALNQPQGSAMQQSTARPVLPHQVLKQAKVIEYRGTRLLTMLHALAALSLQ